MSAKKAAKKVKSTHRRTYPRDQRRHTTAVFKDDPRSAFGRDRDRILYSSYFRRLALITQVVSPDEGYDFHNRLTHVLKVAQIGRRLAEKLVESTDEATLAKNGGLDPEVVEAACLAHDLGHPPFGHVAEKVLDKKARDAGSLGGFEGNAQSFRIVTKLERKYRDCPGLNLTRATLAAVLKYPWLRGETGKERDKWGSYASEKTDFTWARRGQKAGKRSLEAALMDWADDIAYSVHDMEDFYRCGRVPLHRLRQGHGDREFESLLNGAARRCKLTDALKLKWEEQAQVVLQSVPVTRRYDRSPAADINLSVFGSWLITRFVEATTLTENGLSIDEDIKIQVDLLKELTWQYVIEDPGLATQQRGQKLVIETLFDIFQEEALRSGDNFKLFPLRYREELQKTEETEERIRVVVDFVSSMTEQQAVKMYHRLAGVSLGSLFMMDF